MKKFLFYVFLSGTPKKILKKKAGSRSGAGSAPKGYGSGGKYLYFYVVFLATKKIGTVLKNKRSC
jgi:hypothetical protein